MAGSGIISDVVDAAPDWATITDEILCPLCDYNLRGLVEPRCPECGHQFVWREVLDRNERLHPYLFEHHPRRNVWSFLRTFFTSLLPRRFWQTLRPIHPPKVRRLVLYWIVGAAVVALTFVGPSIVAPVARGYFRRVQDRSMLVEKYLTNPDNRRNIIANFGSVQAYLDSQGYNSPLLWEIRRSIRTRSWLNAEHLPTFVTWVLWPWLTFGSLLIYRISMRQAKINPVHVLRCVIYTADAGVIVVPLLIACSFLLSTGDDSMAILLMLPIMTYHLAVAYHRYLHFPRAIPAVIASQLIVGLVFLNLHLYWLYY